MILLNDERITADLTRGTRPWTYLGKGWKPMNEILRQFEEGHSSWEACVTTQLAEFTLADFDHIWDVKLDA